MPQGNQCVAFGVIGARTIDRDVVGDDLDRPHLAPHSRLDGGADGDPVTGMEAQPNDVIAIQEDHAARALDAAEAVFVAIHRGVELIVAAQGHQLQYIAPLTVSTCSSRNASQAASDHTLHRSGWRPLMRQLRQHIIETIIRILRVDARRPDQAHDRCRSLAAAYASGHHVLRD